MTEPFPFGCECWSCLEAYRAEYPFVPSPGQVFDPILMRFVACETCGNKRCPHANDHNNACTNSNEPGQKGSSYE